MPAKPLFGILFRNYFQKFTGHLVISFPHVKLAQHMHEIVPARRLHKDSLHLNERFVNPLTCNQTHVRKETVWLGEVGSQCDRLLQVFPDLRCYFRWIVRTGWSLVTTRATQYESVIVMCQVVF